MLADKRKKDNMSEHSSAFSEFSRSIWAKVLGVLTVIMMVLGIYVEIVTAWRGTSEGITLQAVARESAKRQEAERREKQALAEKTAADQRTAEAIANESRLRQDAERREKQALADKAAADERTAEAIANESKKRQEAERREKEALAEIAAIKAQNEAQRSRGEAEKLDGEGKVSQAAARYAEMQKAADAAKAQAEADLTRAKAVQAAVIARAFDPSFGTGTAAAAPRASRDVGGEVFDKQLAAVDRLTGGTGNPARDGLLASSPELERMVNRSYNATLDSVIGGRGGRSATVRPTEFQSTQKVTVSAAVAPAAPLPPQKLMVSVAADQLTLRHDPDKTAEAILVLNKGAQVQVMSTDAEGWQQVAIVDQGVSFKSYVNGKYATTDLSTSPVPVIITEPADLDTPAFCGHENEPIEYIICSNAELAGQESAMVKSYSALLARMNDATALRRSQTQWVNERRLNCNVPAKGRPTRTVPANMVQCVMDSTDARKHNLRMGRY
jgi:hypothetical protein